MAFQIRPAEDPEAAYEPILAHLLRFNERAVGDARGEPFALTIADEGSTEIAGGLWGMSLWGSFYIALIVAPEGARGHGLGQKMMHLAEAEARRRGCRNIWLDTFAVQARPFYERLGYQVFGQIDGPAPAFPRYFMRKDLPT